MKAEVGFPMLAGESEADSKPAACLGALGYPKALRTSEGSALDTREGSGEGVPITTPYFQMYLSPTEPLSPLSNNSHSAFPTASP